MSSGWQEPVQPGATGFRPVLLRALPCNKPLQTIRRRRRWQTGSSREFPVACAPSRPETSRAYQDGTRFPWPSEIVSCRSQGHGQHRSPSPEAVDQAHISAVMCGCPSGESYRSGRGYPHRPVEGPPQTHRVILSSATVTSRPELLKHSPCALWNMLSKVTVSPETSILRNSKKPVDPCHPCIRSSIGRISDFPVDTSPVSSG